MSTIRHALIEFLDDLLSDDPELIESAAPTVFFALEMATINLDAMIMHGYAHPRDYYREWVPPALMKEPLSPAEQAYLVGRLVEALKSAPNRCELVHILSKGRPEMVLAPLADFVVRFASKLTAETIFQTLIAIEDMISWPTTVPIPDVDRERFCALPHRRELVTFVMNSGNSADQRIREVAERLREVVHRLIVDRP